MAGRYPIKCDQGSTLVRSFRVTSRRGEVRTVTNTTNPTIGVDRPHGLSVGDEVCIAGVAGAVGVNNTPLTPVWTVASVPSSTTFTVATDAPGVFVAPAGDARPGAVSVPRSLVGYTARMQVRTSVAAEAAVVDATTENGAMVIAPPAGSAVVHQVRLTVAASATAALAPGVYRYDVEIVSTDAVVERIAEGPLTIRAEVTR